MRLQRSGNDMVFRVSDTDQVTVRDWFSSTYYQLEQVQFANGTVWTASQILAMPVAINGTDGADTLTGGSENNVIDGGAGDDTITDYSGINLLRGGSGNDTITGTGTFEGGQGDDALVSADYVNRNYWSNADTYVFNAGDGRDTIREFGYQSTTDTLRFGAGIESAGVRLQRSGNDMVFRVSDTDQVTVKDWFSSTYYQLEQVQFANGTVWTASQILAMPVAINGTDGADPLTGGSENNVIDGGAGDDTITDYSGINLLRGGSGNDTITGTGTFEGGQGDDALVSADYVNRNYWSNADTYVFNAGDGRDTIREFGYQSTTDTLRFGAGIESAGVRLQRSGNDMVFRVSDTDQVTVKDWFSSTYYQLEQVQFANGTAWDLAAIQANVLTDLNGTESADTLNGTASSDNIIGLAGDDILNGLAGNDRLDGGAGSDIMAGGSGNDIYVLGHDYGADTVQENDATAGNTDILQFLGGIASDQIWLRQASNDLEVSIIGSTDKATLTNWYLGSQYHIEQFKTSDGKTLLDSQVQNLVSAMAAFAPPAAGQTTLSASYAAGLAPVMAANWQ